MNAYENEGQQESEGKGAVASLPAASDEDVDYVHDDVGDLADHACYERELFSIRRVVGLGCVELVIGEVLE